MSDLEQFEKYLKEIEQQQKKLKKRLGNINPLIKGEEIKYPRINNDDDGLKYLFQHSAHVPQESINKVYYLGL